ncbi:hypothetical protein O1L60_46235 [Streptomyces diastatochromogenes]|nr:hypothetical protein [Streptomyces diastatochromogenes]
MGRTALEILSRTHGGAFSRLTVARAHHRTAHWMPAPTPPTTSSNRPGRTPAGTITENTKATST